MKKTIFFFITIIIIFSLLGCDTTLKDNNESDYIKSISINADGYLVINNQTTDLKVQGSDGKDGRDGKDGINGKDGENGINGYDGKNGKNGLTPFIGDNGDWWIGDTDTGYKAETEVTYFTITFDVNGGTLPEGYQYQISVPKGTLIEDLPIPITPNPENPEEIFEGWWIGPYYDANSPGETFKSAIEKNKLSGYFNTSMPVLKNMTLTALYGLVS